MSTLEERRATHRRNLAERLGVDETRLSLDTRVAAVCDQRARHVLAEEITLDGRRVVVYLVRAADGGSGFVGTPLAEIEKGKRAHVGAVVFNEQCDRESRRSYFLDLGEIARNPKAQLVLTHAHDLN